MSAAVSPEGGAAGRTRITAKALDRIAQAVIADEFGVTARDVSVRLTDEQGALSLRAESRVRTVSIDRARREPRALERAGGGLLQRAERADPVIRRRFEELTGRRVAAVAVRFTAVAIQTEERVR